MHHHYWENLVVFYLYFGGLSAGLFVFSSLFTFWGGDGRYRSLARTAAMIAPWPVAIGSGLLIFDLGSPLRFWRLFSTIQWTSPMSIGSWLLIAFTGVAFLHMLLWKFPTEPQALRLGRRTLKLPGRETRRELRRFLALGGAFLAIGVGIYTGVLLGAIPARPFWNTPMVAMLFLFSAISTAAALLLILNSRKRKDEDPAIHSAQRRFLFSADIAIILLEIFILIPYILHNALSTRSQANSLELVLGGPFTKIFWIGFVALGLVLPLIIEIFDLLPLIAGKEKRVGSHHVALTWISGLAVLMGGFLLRWIFVYAGQVSQFG